MYAIIKAGGKQFRVEEKKVISIDLLNQEVGSTLEIEDVLLVRGGDNDVKVGTPTVAGAKVTAKVLSHYRDKKVIVFKKKRRKGYRKTQGHRQNYTRIQIESIAV